ncbi:MAG: DegV family EDD domain-containing protein [Lachnospiraceae bacterium]|nr:DegV family EDD domain-containing protein [Lachnospiraceae bacterium]
MDKRKICITTDCACDLPADILKRYDIDLMYFYIETDTGRFRDVDEITAQNVFEYVESGGRRAVSKAPLVEDFRDFFNQKLRNCDEIIHIAISSRISMCVRNSTSAAGQLGAAANRIHIFDSGHLSTGIGLLVMHAAEMAEMGYGVEEILASLERMREKVSTTFIAKNADYLYRNEKVSKTVKELCSKFSIHPVLEMKNGYLKMKTIQIGDYEKCALRYVRKTLKNTQAIDAGRVFITHAGCTVNDIKMIRREVDKLMAFDSVMVSNASATISGNSGPRTFGVLFVKK